MTTIPSNKFITPYTETHKAMFRRIVTTVVTMDGWATPEKACTLAALVLANKPDVVVEIGVWAGRSLLPMALACNEINHGKVIGVDPYNAADSSEGEFAESLDWWANQDHEAIFQKFKHFTRLMKVENRVELVRKRSDDYNPPKVINLLHIDGSHSEQAVRDAERFCPNVPVGGYCVFDDLTWAGGAVLRAMDVAEELGFKEVERFVNATGDNWAVFVREK